MISIPETRAIEDITPQLIYQFDSGQPCHHIGCEAHLSHPYEVCNRIGAKGTVHITDSATDDRMNSHHITGCEDRSRELGTTYDNERDRA